MTRPTARTRDRHLRIATAPVSRNIRADSGAARDPSRTDPVVDREYRGGPSAAIGRRCRQGGADTRRGPGVAGVRPGDNRRSSAQVGRSPHPQPLLEGSGAGSRGAPVADRPVLLTVLLTEEQPSWSHQSVRPSRHCFHEAPGRDRRRQPGLRWPERASHLADRPGGRQHPRHLPQLWHVPDQRSFWLAVTVVRHAPRHPRIRSQRLLHPA